ncbi:MAG: peroxiredoxin [Gemmataceae bacterium]
MKHVLAITCLALILAPALRADQKTELKVGDPAPVFEATDDQGKTFKSTDVVGKKVLVVYFYPADLTGGCTKQACGFRDDMAKLADKGVEVVGVSGDSVENHKIFKKEKMLNFSLLADEKGEVAKKFGVPFKPGPATVEVKDAAGNPLQLTRGGTASRWTFVIGKDGKVALKNTQVKAADDSKAILEAVEQLK